jgi:hypothetical protein
MGLERWRVLFPAVNMYEREDVGCEDMGCEDTGDGDEPSDLHRYEISCVAYGGLSVVACFLILSRDRRRGLITRDVVALLSSSSEMPCTGSSDVEVFSAAVSLFGTISTVYVGGGVKSLAGVVVSRRGSFPISIAGRSSGTRYTFISLSARKQVLE